MAIAAAGHQEVLDGATGLNHFGPIAGARYSGFLGAKLKKGILWYELMYDVRFEGTPGSTGTLIATLADRAAGPRLLDFSIDDRPIQMQSKAGAEVVTR